MERNKTYLLNTKQVGEGLEMLTNLEPDSVGLVIFDPQYEPASKVLNLNYPLYPQSDYQILTMLTEIERVLKPSSFCLLWVNRKLLGNDRIPNWMIKVRDLKIMDFLVWHKQDRLGVGNWLRANAEYAFLLQKQPTSKRAGQHFLNRSIGNVWVEPQLSHYHKQHPHQKPYQLSKTLLEATTQVGDLVVEPCAGSFQLLEVCRELDRNYLGVDLTYLETQQFVKAKKQENWKP